MIAGLLKPDWGHVRVGGETLFDAAAGIDVPPERRCAGYVFREARLFPHKRVRANLLYGRHEGAALDIDDTVGFFGIGHLLDRWPRRLSGGEARRSEEHTSELQSLMRISYDVSCLKKKTKTQKPTP